MTVFITGGARGLIDSLEDKGRIAFCKADVKSLEQMQNAAGYALLAR